MNYKIIAKFIKDISFEIPSAQAFIMLEKEISNYALNFDIKSKPYKDNIIEVNTVFSMSPNQNVKHKIVTEITGIKYNSRIGKNNNISRKIIKPDKDELQLHKEFLKSIFKKNF